MTDWARFLPLSNRDRGDERDVGTAWSPATAALLEAIAAAMDARPDLLAAPTLRPDVTTAAAVRQLLSDLDARWYTGWARALYAARATSLSIAQTADEALASAVRARAVPGARSSIRDLGLVVVLALDLRATHGLALTVDPLLCGAVALDLALRAPMPQRSVVTARTFVAVDGGWRVGRGPALSASAASIVLFLAGRADVPPESAPNPAADEPHIAG